MKKLILTNEESVELVENGAVEITRNGFDILVEYDDVNEDYVVTIINPYEKVVVKNSSR